ncbi:MAG: PTS sugar transporter subunit IIA [Candidatus Ratteibacteria bacterium]|nr:PTS sugar transporter subunit IIA [Candidatus Ratteibacteria bacterium]
MIGVVITGHGNFPKELISTSRKIIGNLKSVVVITTRYKEEPFGLRTRLNKAVEKVASQEGVLILTDIFGSSASSMCISMKKKYPVRVVTGMNLPMVFALATYRNSALNIDDLASMLEKVGKKSVTKW